MSTPAPRRFGQGIAVDRNRPHLFHRDYHTLRVIRQGVMDFADRFASELQVKKVLDFGCGVSPYAPWFERHGIELLRADIDPTDPSVLPIDPETGRAPLDYCSMAGVVSTQVLEHVPNIQAYLREARRVLAPGGRLLLTTHGAFLLHRAPTDLRRWTTDGLRYELEQAGFAVESVEPKIGILAFATHLRAMTYGGLTHRVPLTGWLRPLIYLVSNLRMSLEDWLTPRSVMEAHPEILIATARRA
ncbi:MAG: class I SAM-dependent methyltransferase [Tepidisphaeraceae bacterium]